MTMCNLYSSKVHTWSTSRCSSAVKSTCVISFFGRLWTYRRSKLPLLKFQSRTSPSAPAKRNLNSVRPYYLAWKFTLRSGHRRPGYTTISAVHRTRSTKKTCWRPTRGIQFQHESRPSTVSRLANGRTNVSRVSRSDCVFCTAHNSISLRMQIPSGKQPYWTRLAHSQPRYVDIWNCNNAREECNT